jgi:hypothetical protein
MAIFGCGLESCTHTHTKHSIVPRCTKVKQRSNHGAIYLLINRCATHIKIKMTISVYGSLDGLCLVHAKLLEYVTSILHLVNECPILDLLDLKSKKECENPHHEHFTPIGHDFAKLFKKDLLVEPKIMSSTYIWHTNKSLSILLVKRVESPVPILKSLSIRKSLMHSYHALGACLSP